MNDKIKKAATLTDSDAAASQEILQQAPCATTVAHDLKATDIREDKVTDKELIEMMRTQYAVTSSSYSLFHRDKNNLAVIYDEMVDRFRDQHLAGEKREGKPCREREERDAAEEAEEEAEHEAEHEALLARLDRINACKCELCVAYREHEATF